MQLGAPLTAAVVHTADLGASQLILHSRPFMFWLHELVLELIVVLLLMPESLLMPVLLLTVEFVVTLESLTTLELTVLETLEEAD